MIVQLVWATKNDLMFEQSVPLRWHGEYLARNGWSNGIKIGFMEGIGLLSADYLKQLERLGYDVIDCYPLVKECLGEFPEIEAYDTTNRYWFLRWNVLDSLASRQGSPDTVVHFDADVVFMTNPAELYKDVKGKNLVLQGCPVMTVISSKEWFSVWRTELASFLGNPEKYLRNALRIKEHPIVAPRDSCNGLFFQPNRFHDQDMLEYLIAAGLLPQTRTEEVFASRYYWMQNPLLPGEWHEEQAPGVMKRVVEQEECAYVGEKRVAFYHFQSDFAKYCLTWRQFSRLGMERTASLLRTGGPGRRQSRLAAWSGALLDILNHKVNRLEVYESVFRRNSATKNLFITDIVNSCWD